MKLPASRLLSLLLALILLLSGCQTGAVTEPASPAPPPPVSIAPESSIPQEPAVPESAREITVPGNYNPCPAFEPHSDFIWEVTGGTGVVYLMGTMHVIKPTYSLTPEIVALLDSSDALAVEANMLSPSIYVDMIQYMTYPDYSSIFDHLSERGRSHLSNMCLEYGIDEQSIEMYHPVTASSMFLGAILEDTEFLSNGVDMLLLLRANELMTPILELEDYKVYFNALRSLDDDTLERTCIMTIQSLDSSREELERMYDTYLSGDEAAMLASFGEEEDAEYISGDGQPLEFEDKDELYNQYMIFDRNRVMTDSVIGYLESQNTTFVAAGLAHFLGDDSIISMLEAEGYIVERILAA